MSGTSVLSIEALDVDLQGRRVLDAVDLELRAGEFAGLIGSNGAGKTTLFRSILGLVRPSGGKIVVASDGPRRRERSVGYVPQKTLLDGEAPVRARDLVALGLDGHRFGVPLRAAARRRAVEEMLDAVGAGRFADARVGELSGGEQQRVLIAHALISRPKLLLLDEPLANLDLHSAQEVIELLRRVADSNEVAVLLSAHEMNPLLPVMDRIAYLAGGRMASGTVEEVVRPDVLSKLYGHHVDVLRLHGRVLVVAGPGSGDESLLSESPALIVG